MMGDAEGPGGADCPGSPAEAGSSWQQRAKSASKHASDFASKRHRTGDRGVGQPKRVKAPSVTGGGNLCWDGAGLHTRPIVVSPNRA